MGFLDKLQQTAKETLDKGKEKLEDVQADRAADKLLRDRGAWYYAGRTGRDGGAAAEHIERLMGELQAHEAEHGELGAKDEPESPAEAAPAEAAPAAAVGDPAPSPAPAPPPAAPAAPVDPVAEAPAAPAPAPPPVTPGPPPPPPA